MGSHGAEETLDSFSPAPRPAHHRYSNTPYFRNGYFVHLFTCVALETIRIRQYARCACRAVMINRLNEAVNSVYIRTFCLRTGHQVLFSHVHTSVVVTGLTQVGAYIGSRYALSSLYLYQDSPIGAHMRTWCVNAFQRVILLSYWVPFLDPWPVSILKILCESLGV